MADAPKPNPVNTPAPINPKPGTTTPPAKGAPGTITDKGNIRK